MSESNESNRSFSCVFCGALAVVQTSWQENVCPKCHDAGLDGLPVGLQRAVKESLGKKDAHQALAYAVARWVDAIPDVLTATDLSARGGPPRLALCITGSDVQVAGFGPTQVVNGEAELYAKRLSEAIQEFFWADHEGGR